MGQVDTEEAAVALAQTETTVTWEPGAPWEDGGQDDAPDDVLGSVEG